MKAKELIKLLKANLEAEVVMEIYTGCETPHLKITKIDVLSEGDKLYNSIGQFDYCNSSKVTEQGVIKKGSIINLLVD